MSRTTIEKRIAQGTGDEPADLVLKGGRVLDLVTGELLEGDVAICGDTIVGTCESYDGRETLDVSGLTLVPGFIDTHLHIESSLVTPFEFDRCVAPRGITTAICDPHEIANVIGVSGIRYFQEASLHTVMSIFVQLSSCVPSTDMETAGATVDCRRPCRPDRSPERHRPRRDDELPRRHPPRPRRDGQARPLRRRPHRRPLPDAVRPRAQRLHRRRRAHRARGDHRRRGDGEAAQGHARPDPRRLRLEGPRRAGRDPHRADRAVPVPVHRRPQPARHLGTRPSRLHHPHPHRARGLAARRLPRRLAFGGRGVRPEGSRADRARQACRHRGARQPRGVRCAHGAVRRHAGRRYRLRRPADAARPRSQLVEGAAGGRRVVPRRRQPGGDAGDRDHPRQDHHRAPHRDDPNR